MQLPALSSPSHVLRSMALNLVCHGPPIQPLIQALYLKIGRINVHQACVIESWSAMPYVCLPRWPANGLKSRWNLAEAASGDTNAGADSALLSPTQPYSALLTYGKLT
jgi:hypothetical protein